MLDFNRTVVQSKIANDALNGAIDEALVKTIGTSAPRDYLGASSLGHDCSRKIHWDWRRPVPQQPRIERIFTRGRWWESYCVEIMHEAGFRMVRGGDRIAFRQLDGLFRGHGDGMIVAGPAAKGVAYPCAWECKGLGSKGWTKLGKEGLAKAYPGYADQVALYQAYFDLTENPAIFTAANMDTMEILHLLVPFDPERAQAASDRAVNIVRADGAGETLPRVAADADDWRCKMCSHREACWADA